MKSLIIGSVILDEIYEISVVPKSGEEALVHNHYTNVGGCAFNVAANLRILNQQVDLLAPVGEGQNASMIKNTLAQYQLKSLLKMRDTDNGKCVILVNQEGERTFLTWPTLKQVNQTMFQDIQWDTYDNICIDGYRIRNKEEGLLITLIAQVKHARLFFAPGPMIKHIDPDNMHAILDLHPILHLNKMEIMSYMNSNNLEASIHDMAHWNENDIYVTMGQDGLAHYQHSTGTINYYAAHKVGRVVNTNGAGDTHLAALIAFLNQKMPIDQVCIQANQLASKIVQSKNSVLTKQEVANVI